MHLPRFHFIDLIVLVHTKDERRLIKVDKERVLHPKGRSTRVTTQIQSRVAPTFSEIDNGNYPAVPTQVFRTASRIEDLFNASVCQTFTIIDSLLRINIKRSVLSILILLQLFLQ